MNHLASIQAEFVKEARKWDDLTYEEQKGYLSRHPKTKRKITAKPGKGKAAPAKKETGRAKKKLEEKKKRVKKTPEAAPSSSSGTPTYADFAAKLEGKSRSDISNEIAKLEAKVEKRNQAAARREQRAQGDLDGTSFERAYEKSRPDILRADLLKHFLTNGKKKLPEELQNEFDSVNEEKARAEKYKAERKEKLNEHKDLMGKEVTWKSSKNFGKEMTGRVVEVKSTSRRGPYVKTDTGWRVPISMIQKSKAVADAKQGTTRVTPKSLVGKTITWPTKFQPGYHKTPRRMRPGKLYRSGPKQAPPGYDPETQTATGVVSAAKGQKLVVDNWTIPMTMIKKVDNKDFTGWE